MKLSFPCRRVLQISLLIAFSLGAGFPVFAETHALLRKQINSAPRETPLAEASGRAEWEATGGLGGLDNPQRRGGRILGTLTGQPARFPVGWPEPGADLDLGFNDFLDFELRLPSRFDGEVFIDFAADRARGDQGAAGRIAIPASALIPDAELHRYRLDLGLVPAWRGFLREVTLTIEPGTTGQPVEVGAIQVGDRPEDEIFLHTDLNLEEGIDRKDLRRMESKHGCIWWTSDYEKTNFDPEVMGRRALRMIEETWQVAVNMLGYRDPCLGVDRASTKRHKINHTTWYDGFWMGADEAYPYFNVGEGGLRDEGWGNPVPHEFAHCVQAAQIDFLRGAHWESHANYVRFHRNLHFEEWIGGIDPMPFNTIAHAHYYQDHPSLIYSDYRPYFYLDSDPDRLGFEPGLTAKLWQTGTKDELFWDRLPSILPDGVTRETVAAGIARSWVTFDFYGGDRHREAYFPGGREGALRHRDFHTPLFAAPDRPGTWAVPLAKAPMKFGWCVHALEAEAGEVEAHFEGIDVAGEGESWRWGFVAHLEDGGFRVSSIFGPGTGRFKLPADFERLSLFVVATPADPSLPYARPTPQLAAGRHPDLRRYPYEVSLEGASPAVPSLDPGEADGAPHRNGGGFVARSAKVDASAFIGPHARVLDRAQVLGDARILDRAVVAGSAVVRDEAVVSGGALVHGQAEVRDGARVRGFATVGGRAEVHGQARIEDFARVEMETEVHDQAVVRGTAKPLGRGKIHGHAILDTDYSMDFSLSDGVHFHHVPWGGWYLDEFATAQTIPRGLVASYDFDESDGAQALDEFGALHASLRGNPGRSEHGISLDGADQYVALDPSVLDADDATWVIEGVYSGRELQPIFSINDWQTDGLLIGVGESGQLAAVLNKEGERTVNLVSSTPVARRAPFRVSLRLDGERARLFLGDTKVADEAWPHPPRAMFRDRANPEPPAVYLGRDAGDARLTGEIRHFRAFRGGT